MFFNESNVKVIRENGYLSKYVGKKAPYFPFTKNDIKNNVIFIVDSSYEGSRIFIQLSTNIKNKAYFYAPYGVKHIELIFDFDTMEIMRVN